MPLQIRVAVYKCIVKITYYYSLILGIVPGPYKYMEQQFHITIWYLVYSALVQFCFLAITPLTLNVMQQKDTYMSNKPILLYSYFVGKLTRILTIVVISSQIWLRRRNCLLLCEAFKRFFMKYESYCEFMSLFIGQNVKKEEKRLQRLMICKFISLHIHALAIALMYIQMQEQPERGYFIMISLNLMQGLYLLSANLQFMLIISELSLKFFYINRSLNFLSYCRFPLKDMLKFYLIAYQMHVECLEITRSLLRASNSVTWFMLVKIFTTNIIILYHAVLVRMSSLPSNTLGNTVGVLCIINFYWDSLLVIQAIDNILAAGNTAAFILRDTWITLKEEDNKDDYKQIMQLVSLLGIYVHTYIIGQYNTSVRITV